MGPTPSRSEKRMDLEETITRVPTETWTHVETTKGVTGGAGLLGSLRDEVPAGAA